MTHSGPLLLTPIRAKLKAANVDSDFKREDELSLLDSAPAQHSVREALGHHAQGPWAGMAMFSQSPGRVLSLVSPTCRLVCPARPSAKQN